MPQRIKPIKRPALRRESSLRGGQLQANDQVLYYYCDENGKVDPAFNHNGASRNIAGIRNKEGNVFGMMPHPERATSELLGNTDGRKILNALLLQPAGSLTVTQPALAEF